MNLEQAFKQEDTSEIFIEGQCHDCGKPVKVKVTQEENSYKFEAQGKAAQYAPEIDGEKYIFYKCKKCYDKEHTLKNFRPTEVFTRVVGYYRPIKNFNMGKKEEYKNRKNFAHV